MREVLTGGRFRHGMSPYGPGYQARIAARNAHLRNGFGVVKDIPGGADSSTSWKDGKPDTTRSDRVDQTFDIVGDLIGAVGGAVGDARGGGSSNGDPTTTTFNPNGSGAFVASTPPSDGIPDWAIWGGVLVGLAITAKVVLK